jgi:hypothetical protein
VPAWFEQSSFSLLYVWLCYDNSTKYVVDKDYLSFYLTFVLAHLIASDIVGEEAEVSLLIPDH